MCIYEHVNRHFHSFDNCFNPRFVEYKFEIENNFLSVVMIDVLVFLQMPGHNFKIQSKYMHK